MPLFGSSHSASSLAKTLRVSSTELRYDNLLCTDPNEQPVSHGFRSSLTKRHNFTQLEKEHYRDDFDRSDDVTRVITSFKSVCYALESILDLQSFEEGGLEGRSRSIEAKLEVKTQRLKKRRLNRYSGLEDEHQNDENYGDHENSKVRLLDVKLKKAESKIKFQRELIQKQGVSSDPIFPRFSKTTVSAHTPAKPQYGMHDYMPTYTLSPKSDRPLSKQAATSLLKSRFTTSKSQSGDAVNQSSVASSTTTTPRITPPTMPTRTITKIRVNPLLIKRLGI